MKIRVGFGFDVHQLVEGRELWLGGILLEHTKGLLGHSDADVLLHAVCDALLGAANMRDIGYHFYITRDGEIHRGRSLEEVGAHCRNHNAHSIGVCYEGGLDANGKPKDTRTLEQKGALLALLRELKRQFPKALVVGHRDLNPMKGCPCFDAVKEYAEITPF
jgi:N-acetylmuramoyl-L-alanine amidase